MSTTSEANQPLVVVVSGGGPVGLTFSLHLTMMMGKHVKILIYEGRWFVDDQGKIRWQNEKQGKTRRDQVVTLQDHVIQQMPEYIQKGLFQNISECVWPTSRNIAISEVEDRLLDLIQPFVQNGQIDLIPENLYEQSECLIEGNFDILVGADGSNSFVRRYCNIRMISEGVEYACGVAYNIPDKVVPADEPLNQALNCILTISQTRYLVNSSRSRRGYLNIRLIQSEYDALRKDLQELQSRNEPIDLLDYNKCPQSPIWTIIRQGLYFFKISSKYVFRVVPIKINVCHASIVVRELRFEVKKIARETKDPEEKRYKTALAFLAGDAAMNVHFWPGRGMNSGMKGAMALARNILRSCTSNNSIHCRTPLRFLDFLDYEGFMARLRAREQQGRSLRVLDDPIDKYILEAFQVPQTNPCYLTYKQKLLHKLKDNRDRLEGRPEWPHKSRQITNGELQSAVNYISFQAIAQLTLANPWPTREMSGAEVLVEDAFPYDLENFLPVPKTSPVTLKYSPSVIIPHCFVILWITGDKKMESVEKLVQDVRNSENFAKSSRTKDGIHQLTVVQTIEEAKQWIRANKESIRKPDVSFKVITSWKIKDDETAVDVIQAVRSEFPQVPVLVFTNKHEETSSAHEFPDVMTTDMEFELKEFVGVNQETQWDPGYPVSHDDESTAENQNPNVNILDFLKPNRCVYSIKVDYNNPSIIQCFEILKPYCDNPEGPLHTTFNTIVDEPLDTNILSCILSDQTSAANSLTSYVVDSLKRNQSLSDIIRLLSEVLDTRVDNNTDNKYETLVDQLTKRMLLVQALENISYDSQRFLCNFIRKNDLPIPLSYRVWNWTEKMMYYRINFNCLMETLCVTDLRLLLQFGSPSASGLGKTSLIGYLFDDKRRESFFTDVTDCSWRDGCVDVLFSNQFTIFDVHGKTIDIKLIRSIQPYTYVQIIYVTEEDLQGDFLETNIVQNMHTIVVIFDSNYDDLTASTQLLKRFEDKFKQLKNVLWTSAPMLNARNTLAARKIAQRNKRLRETFDQLLKQIESNTEGSSFRSCFQIQSSFYEANPSLTPIKLVFEVETELDRLFSSLSDKTENLLLITPISYQRSRLTLRESGISEKFDLTSSVKDFSRSIQTPCIVNEYHSFTIWLLNQRNYIELLIVESFLEKWRATYVPKLRQEKESLSESASLLSRQLKQAERENSKSSETQEYRQRYEILRTQLKEVDNRLMNADLTFGLLCDELFALWDNIHVTQLNREIEELKNNFDLVATKLAELVYKGFALHVLRGRPLQSHSRLLRMCMEKLSLRDSIAVLTVVGEQSSAKSSLLNSTFGCNFRVSPGRCTIGLYLGLAYYKNMSIMILDTEGLMSLEESGSIFDNQMVTMAVLSSNLVIVNHKGEISSSLEGLIGMSLYAKIHIQSSPFKPNLLFVLRDQTQRDMKIFQQQLNRLKENIQTNAESLQMSIEDELEMKHVVLMPGAFTEDMNRDYGIVQKWRTETFAEEINKLRITVFKSLEAQISETVDTIGLRKNFGTYLYSKLTTNWKSIDDLGEGLLRCQSLYELSVQNGLTYIVRCIIAGQHDQLQKRGSELIETLIKTNNEQMHTNLDTSNKLNPHISIQETVNKGTVDLNELINEQIEAAKKAYDEQTQQGCFNRVKSQWKNIEASVKNMQQYLFEQLEIRILETALKRNRDYYRRELFNIKMTSTTSDKCITRLNQRVQELEIEITDNLQTYIRNRDDIIKRILDVYNNVIQTKNANIHLGSTYNICPRLNNTKYLDAVRELDIIINKYVNRYIKQTEYYNLSPSIVDIQSPSIRTNTLPLLVSKQDDRTVLQWFSNSDDPSKNARTLRFVFDELLRRINDQLDMSPLYVSYSDPKMMHELIEIIDYELYSKQLDMSHINRPSFIRDLIIFMLYLLFEKTDQRFELKNKQLLTETLNDLHQIKQNVLDQIVEDEQVINHGKLFRRILGKEIIREVERIHRQKLIEETHSKLNQNFAIDPTDVTRHIYSESIASQRIDPKAILKLVSDPSHFCIEQIYLNIKDLCQQFIEIYSNDTKTMVTACMLRMTDVILNNDCVDTHVLHKLIVQQIVKILPGFQASHDIEVERNIKNPNRFQEYFRKFQFFNGESDDVLLAKLTKVRERFSGIVLRECFETLLYRSIGCRARCPGCGIKCELPAKTDPSEEHHHYSQYHLPMAFNGWPRNDQLHPHLTMCYQQWKDKTLFRGDNLMSTPEEFFSLEAPDWYHDVQEKSEKGEACAEHYPLVEHRHAWMAVRYKLIKEFELRDQDTYDSGVYPMSIVSIPNDFEVLWESL